MSKPLLQDVIKVKDIRKNKNPEKMEKIVLPKKDKEHIFIDSTENSKSGSRYGLWFVAFISIVFLLFALSFLFTGAKVLISPKIKDVTFSEDLTAVKDSTDDNTLPFDLVMISGNETKSVQGGEQKEVSTEATGTVVVYNSFGTSTQKLLVNTKLEGSNGKIYKTKTTVTIPGITKGGMPGSIEVDVSAEKTGIEYNSNPIDFKIIGFKGTDKYAKIYGRSKTPLVGGFEGKVSQVSDADQSDAISGLKDTLQSKLLQKVKDQIPSGYILFKDAIFLDTDNATNGMESSDGMVPITLDGTLYGLLFNEQKLTQKIVADSIPDYDGSDVYISNINDLIFNLDNKENVSFKDVTNISFNLSGTPKIVWKIDPTKLVADLLGKSKSDFNQILSQYKNINSADLILKPVWQFSLPDKSKDINVIVNYPQ